MANGCWEVSIKLGNGDFIFQNVLVEPLPGPVDWLIRKIPQNPRQEVVNHLLPWNNNIRLPFLQGNDEYYRRVTPCFDVYHPDNPIGYILGDW